MTSATKSVDSSAVGEDDNYKFRITCSKFEQFSAGSQVYIRYGKYSNRQLLCHYGFSMRENIYNYARIKIKLGHFLSPHQAAALGKGYSLDLFTVFKLKSSEICLDLVNAFRSFSWNISVNKSESFFYPCELMLEIEAIQKMENVLLDIMKSFPTTIEHDETLLNTSNSRLYFAVIAR